MEYKVYVDSPDTYACSRWAFDTRGSSPRLLEVITGFLNRKDVVEVNAALYLFNNKGLHQQFTELSRRGVKVNVISIPLAGYDASRPAALTDYPSCMKGETRYTKRDLAEPIYREVLANDLYNLMVFPHVYARTAHKKFARGQYPFSLHSKTFLISYANGESVSLVTSSNLAVRDLIKDELMVATIGETSSFGVAQTFFKDLIALAVPLHDAGTTKEVVSYTPSTAFAGLTEDTGDFFVAPFYYGSHEQVEDKLFQLLAAAKQRVYICAQHICTLEYEIQASQKDTSLKGKLKRPGFLAALRGKAARGVEVKCLSQTYAEAGRSLDYVRSPANKTQFERFSRLFRAEALGSYAVNERLHAKFIVVDNCVVVSTCNFTPTQFMHLPNAVLGTWQQKQRCVFGEVGHWLFIRNHKELSDTLARYFQHLWHKPATRTVIG